MFTFPLTVAVVCDVVYIHTAVSSQAFVPLPTFKNHGCCRLLLDASPQTCCLCIVSLSQRYTFHSGFIITLHLVFKVAPPRLSSQISLESKMLQDLISGYQHPLVCKKVWMLA